MIVYVDDDDDDGGEDVCNMTKTDNPVTGGCTYA